MTTRYVGMSSIASGEVNPTDQPVSCGYVSTRRLTMRKVKCTAIAAHNEPVTILAMINVAPKIVSRIKYATGSSPAGARLGLRRARQGKRRSPPRRGC